MIRDFAAAADNHYKAGAAGSKANAHNGFYGAVANQ